MPALILLAIAPSPPAPQQAPVANITYEVWGPGGTSWLVRDQIISSFFPNNVCFVLIALLLVISFLYDRLRTTRVRVPRLQSMQNGNRGNHRQAFEDSRR